MSADSHVAMRIIVKPTIETAKKSRWKRIGLVNVKSRHRSSHATDPQFLGFPHPPHSSPVIGIAAFGGITSNTVESPRLDGHLEGLFFGFGLHGGPWIQKWVVTGPRLSGFAIDNWSQSK